MAFQWRDSDGKLCWWEPATMRVMRDGVFVAMALSESEAKQITRGW